MNASPRHVPHVPEPESGGPTLESLTQGVGHLLESLTERRMGERIAERLLTALALGQYWSGQRLPPQRQMAALLEVSRSSVGDGIAILRSQGYVEVRPGRNGGVFVTSKPVRADAAIRRTLLPGWSRLAALMDFRSSVEGQVARIAAERRTKEEAAAIRRLADDYVASGASRESSQHADHALHEAIAAGTHNPFWRDLSISLRYQVNQGLGTEPFSAQLRRRGEEQHPLLAEAIAAGEPDRAAELGAAHFGLSASAVRDLIASVSRQPAKRGTRGGRACP